MYYFYEEPINKSNLIYFLYNDHLLKNTNLNLYNKFFEIKILWQNNILTFFWYILIVIILLILLKISIWFEKKQKFLYFSILISISTFFCLMLIINNNFIWIYITLEGLNLGIYILIALTQTQMNIEASCKYFIINSIATIFFLIGVSYFYWLTNSLQLDIIKTIIEYNWLFLENKIELEIAIMLLCSGLLIKMSAYPFQAWTPEVYEGSLNIIVIFLLIIVKISVFIVFLQLFLNIFQSLFFLWKNILLISSICSFIFGAYMALFEKNLRKFWAYNTINNIGFLLMSLVISLPFNLDAFKNIIFFIIVYNFGLLFQWVIIIFLEQYKSINLIIDIIKIQFFHPNLLIKLQIDFLQYIFIFITGLPPYISFITKFNLFNNLINSHLTICTNLTFILIFLIFGLLSYIYFFSIITHLAYSKIQSIFYQSFTY